jgi:hypothetical protein
MGFYLELFCDNEDCLSGARQEGPMGRTRKEVTAVARASGWARVGTRWLCWNCKHKARADDGRRG